MGKKKPEDTPLDPLLASRIEEIMAKASTQLDPDEKERVRIALRALAPIADKAGDVISDLKDLLSGETDSDDTNGDEGDGDNNGGDDKAPPKKTPPKKAPAKPVPTAKSAEDKKSEEINMEKSDIEAALPTITDPALRTAVESMLKKSAEDEKEKEIALAKAAKLEEEKQVTEFMGKAAEFKHLPTEGLGELMRSVFTALPDLYPKFEDMLRAMDTTVAKSAVFKEVGRNQHAPTSKVEEEVDMIANEVMAKSDGKVNKVAARAKAWNAERYQQYLNEEQKVA
jgi:hypothetical protein